MKITVNGKPRDRLSAGQLRVVQLKGAGSEAEGAVLPADEASRSYRAATARAFTILSGIGIALGLAILGGGLAAAQPADRILVILTGTASAVIVVAGARWRYNRALASWDRRLAERVAALPPAGTRIRVDADGVTLGARRAEWSGLNIGEIELTEQNNENDSTITVDRLVLTAAAGPIVLDRHLMQNGGAVVESAYGKLVRGRGVKEL